MKTLLFAILATTCLCACSSVSVKDYQRTGEVKQPARIHVALFETQDASFRIAGDKDGRKGPEFRDRTAQMLADYTVRNVTKYVAPAVKVTDIKPRDGWLVTGRFTRVATGNRALRMLVGLGAGGSKMETEVKVYDLASSRKRPFLQFATTGGSNAMPGMITSGGPGLRTIYTVIYGANSGTTDDAARTSRMIAGALSEYFGERGWTPKSKVYKMKRPGEYQLVRGL